MKNVEYNKILSDTTSFQLVRTNPKLTSNVKLTVNQSDQMWLDSIEVSSELADDKYKKFRVNPDVSHPANLYNFYDSGKTPNEIAFSLSENVSTVKTSKDYKDQYDFSEYFSGARYFPSKQYTERLSYFAPIYLKQELPEYFVIFKVENPLNYKIDNSELNYPFDKGQYMIDMLKDSTIVKTYDLTESSKVGSYLRKYISDPAFPTGGLTVDYNEDTFTKFNGILIDSGAFGSRSELLSDFYSSSTPLKHFEQFTTKGYERNGVIYPNIMNIEFIFDDETSEYYDFNRYVGFYINKVELDKISTDIDRVYGKRATWPNTPRLRRNVKEYEEVAVIQENQNGVIFPYKETQLKLSEFNSSYSDRDNLYMNYIDDKHGNLYSFKLNDDPILEDIDSSSNELDTGKIKLSKKEINLGDFFGPGRDFLQDEAFSTTNKGYSNSYIKILSELNNGDTIKFYHPTGTKKDSNGKYDDIIATTSYSLVPNSGDYYYYNDIDNIVGNDTFYFNATGLPNEISSAIQGCLNNIRGRTFRVTLIDEYLFIRASSYGNYDDRYAIEYQSPTFNYANVEVAEKTGNDLTGTIFKFEGGSSFSGNRIIMNAEQRENLEDNLNDIIIRTENGWSKIKKISNYIDTIGKGYNDYFDKISVLLELEEKPFIRYGEFIAKLIHRPSFGLLSFLPVRDFDFDFYSSKYLNFPINDLYQFYYIPSDTSILEEDISYQVYGNGTIQWNSGSYVSGDVFTPVSGDELFYTVSTGDPIVSFENVDLNGGVGSSSIPYNDENKELKDFEGFFLLKDPSKVVPEEENEVFKRKERYLNGATQTEYDFYKENFTKDFSLESKLIPYITKWSLLNGKDSRNNPYRLNNELAFGFNNFSPSHDDTTQNPSNFTHEWFYLESKFNYVNDEKTIKLNDSYFEEPLDENKLLNEEDYFIKYFTYTPTLNSIEVGETQTRYSIISKNKVNQFETFLKGFKLNFKDVINENDIGADGKPVASEITNRFENYKFSCILKTFKEDINSDEKPPIKYRVVEHKDFKFILVIIELRIGSEDEIYDFWKELNQQPSPEIRQVDEANYLDQDPTGFTKLYDTINGDYRIKFKTDLSTNLDISNMTYSLLYSLKHKKVNNFINNYSNIKLNSKLDLSSSGAFLVNTPLTIESLENPNTPNYPSSISSELPTATLNGNTIVMPYFKSIDTNFFLKKYDSNGQLNASPFVSTFDKGIRVKDEGSSQPIVKVEDDNGLPTSILPTSISSVWESFYVFKSMVSGSEHYEKIIEKLSFARFKQYVNELDKFIEYESWELDNNNQAQSIAIPNYYVEIPDNENIVKKQGLAALIDSNRPSNFSFINDIGYDYFTSNLDNTYEINRYKGNYEPIFTDVLFFNSNYTFDQTKNNIKEIDLANLSFNVNIDSFGTIENFSHIKISPTKILDLEADTSFEPRYELIDEIAISKKPYFIFSSNWEFGYHHGYKDKANSKPVAGTLRVEEDDSFIGKLINLPNEVDLENFDILELSELELLENVNLDQIEIVSKETSKGIEGYINLNNILSRYFIENGISNSFYQYLINQEKYIGSFKDIDEYIQKYIKLNILKLYETKELYFYTKPDRKLKSKLQTPINSNNIEFVSLDDNQRNEQGFFINKNLEINKYERLILSFNFSKNNDSGTLVSPKIKMKFI